MAFPQVPQLVKCMVVFQGASALPSDRFVNNFWFRKPADLVTQTRDQLADEASTMLTAFYTGTPATGSPILNGLAQGAFTSVHARFYWMEDAPPREPVVRNFDWTIGTTTSNIPLECAAVLSFRSGRSGPRGKGRIYLGPLNAGAIQSGAVPILAPAFRNSIVDRAEDMMNSSMNADWLQVSTTDQEFGLVTGGWVDDAVDTMRKRGPKAKVRQTFGSAYVLAA